MNILTSIRSKQLVPLSVALALVVGMGCASGPPEALKSQMVGTDTSIGQAEQAGAAQAALPELQQAKDKRAKAQAALDEKEYGDAMNWARQAQLDAQFASRKAETARTAKSAQEIERGVDELEKETQRKLQQPSTTADPGRLSEDR
jgi:hypothetical protein